MMKFGKNIFTQKILARFRYSNALLFLVWAFVCFPTRFAHAGPFSTSVIVGELDWEEIVDYPEGTLERQNSHSVGMLYNENIGVCTASIVGQDTLVTANHCVDQRWPFSKITFGYEKGVKYENLIWLDCQGIIWQDWQKDIAAINCKGVGNPNYLSRSSEPVLKGEELYIIHNNCDWITDMYCRPTKKISHCKVKQISGSFLTHTCDTLGGTSGAPIFRASDHKLIGVHHSGSKEREENYGSTL